MIAMPPAVPASASTRTEPATVAAPTIVQSVTVEQTPSRSDLLADTAEWTWEELRDFVVSQIADRFGPFPRDARKEYGIFSRYLNQYGQDGIAVAKYAFGPVCDGWWASAPISINRFCKASDPYFSQPILERLREVGQ